MKRVLGVLLNLSFFVTIIVIVLVISTIALTNKINDYNNRYKNGLTGSVVKHEIPVMSLARGVVEKIEVKTGNEVKKGDLLFTLTNPSLVSEIEALKKFPSNISAQTQVKLYEQKLKELKVFAQTDGVIGKINITNLSVVDEFLKLATIYSNSDIKLLSELTVDQYQAVRHTPKIFAYSARLNQSFEIEPDILNPDVTTPIKFEEKKIGLYFKFKNEKNAVSLLNNEDLIVQLENANQMKTNKPVDFIAAFWNKLLSR